jgi:DNA-binding transcriptional ArsR family regulator
MLILCDPDPMNNSSIARIAGLIGEAGRIQMLTALLSGNGHSASELALAAGVSPQTASSHLAKLLAGSLIVCERSGRQRLYRLKNADVAVAIEALGGLAQKSKTIAVPELRFARTCYDHLAGVLSIALRNELLKKDVLRQRGSVFLLTQSGEQFLRTLDIDAAPLRELRRSFARKCLDWTERHHHVGGAVGAALLSQLMARKWLSPMRGTRAVRLTHEGERAFERVFGIRCMPLRSQSQSAS